MGAFHAYDIRGVYGKDFDSVTAYKVGYFLPSLLGAGEILVGRDCRVSSAEIREALVKGITDAGADVCDIGLSSTPMVYFATANYGFRASVQITASHNAPEYNGLKVSRENALPVGYDAGLGEIERKIESGEPTPVAKVPGKVRTMDIKGDYFAFMRRYKGDYSNIRIAFDLSNGMANLFAKEIFGEGPAYILDTIDGRFPFHEPNPLVEKNREALRALVLGTGADVGVIYDGDADRVMFLDEQGRFVAPDLVIALMSDYFMGERGEKNPVVLQEIRSSKAVAEYLVPMGADVRTWKVGRAFAAPRLREIDGLWGGELAGHYYFRDFFYSDSGLLASEIVLGIVSRLKSRGISLGEMMDTLVRYRNSGEINFKLDHKQEAMDALKNFFMGEDTAIAGMDFDGYRVEFADWWFNVRPSNTEPYLRFICEAKDEQLLERRIAQAKEIIAKFD